MTIDPGISILISFIGFVYIFMKKVYPLLTSALDEHIESVKGKIKEAELLKEEALLMLKNANVKKQDIAKIIRENKEASDERIARLRKENEDYLRDLREKFEILLKNQLEAELSKQKDLLIGRLSEQIIAKLSEKAAAAESDIQIDFSNEDLKKLG
jgi:F0F1-type ATP synthase membrane subunit b/b'